MTEFRVRLEPMQRYETQRHVTVWAGPEGKGSYRGALMMPPEEAEAFVAMFEELALSREILDEEALASVGFSVPGWRLAQYQTARALATKGTT